jgi:hypothetical protein
MSHGPFFAALVAATTLVCAAPAIAADAMVIDIPGDSVTVFDDSGNFLADWKKAEFLDAPSAPFRQLKIIKSDDQKGLLLVETKKGQIWVADNDVKTNVEKTSKIICTKSPKINVADNVTAAAMGLSPCTK